MSKRNQQTDKNSNVNHYITILQSYLIGDEIEHRLKGSNDNWTPCSNPVFDFHHLEYRVKPKIASRPYINGNEAFADMQNHSPSGWVYNTITMCYEHIICIGENGISTCKENYSFEQALKIFIYPNDLKFGVKLDEED
jgi:hypothetical protein